MKDILPNLLRLLFAAALVFIGVELHRMNDRLGDSLNVNCGEVEIRSPIQIDSDSRLGLPVRVRSDER